MKQKLTAHSDKDLSIVIVNHDSREFLRKCLKSIFGETAGINFEVFVVDNNSKDDSSRMVSDSFPEVHLTQNAENVGFAKANNQAILNSRGRYVLLLNPDTVIGSNALVKLMQFMEDHPDAGVAGCKLLNEDGTLQYSMRNFPTITNQLAECFFLHKFLSRISKFGEVIYKNRSYKKIQIADWITGAVFMIRRETLDAVGPLDEDYYLYVEETDWCLRARNAGWKTYYYPGTEVMHVGGECGVNPVLLRLLINSRLIFFKKHKSSFKFLLFKFITFLNLSIRATLWSLARFFIRSKRATLRYGAYSGGLRTVVRPRS